MKLGLLRPQPCLCVPFMVPLEELEELGSDFLQKMPLPPTFPCGKLHEQVDRAVEGVAHPFPRCPFVVLPSDLATSLLCAEMDVVD